MTAHHPYTVTVTDSTGTRTHRFRAMHQAESFCVNLRAEHPDIVLVLAMNGVVLWRSALADLAGR